MGQLHVRVPGSSQHCRGEAGMGRDDAKDPEVGGNLTQKDEVQRAERVAGGLDEPKRPKILFSESKLPVRDRSGSSHESDLADMDLLMVHPEVVTQVMHVRPEREGGVRSCRLTNQAEAGREAGPDETPCKVEDMPEEEHVGREGMDERIPRPEACARSSHADPGLVRDTFTEGLSNAGSGERAQLGIGGEDGLQGRQLRAAKVSSAHLLPGMGLGEGGAVGGPGATPPDAGGDPQGGVPVEGVSRRLQRVVAGKADGERPGLPSRLLRREPEE